MGLQTYAPWSQTSRVYTVVDVGTRWAQSESLAMGQN